MWRELGRGFLGVGAGTLGGGGRMVVMYGFSCILRMA